MTATRDRPSTLVWIDERTAILVHWDEGTARVERLESEVPAHHRSTGSVRHDPAIRHGGGGAPQTADDPHRLEHLARFLDAVTDRLPPDDDVLILGPGNVREHLERQVRETDVRQRRDRRITCQASRRLTDRQLIARLREFQGTEPRRRTTGT